MATEVGGIHDTLSVRAEFGDEAAARGLVDDRKNREPVGEVNERRKTGKLIRTQRKEWKEFIMRDCSPEVRAVPLVLKFDVVGGLKIFLFRKSS